MQQAEGQSGVGSVAQTVLAGGRWDAYISMNALRQAQGSHSGLGEKEVSRGGIESLARLGVFNWSVSARTLPRLRTIGWLGFARWPS